MLGRGLHFTESFACSLSKILAKLRANGDSTQTGRVAQSEGFRFLLSLFFEQVLPPQQYYNILGKVDDWEGQRGIGDDDGDVAGLTTKKNGKRLKFSYY